MICIDANKLKLDLILANLAKNSLDSKPIDMEIRERMHKLFDIIESSRYDLGNEAILAVTEALRLIELEFNPPKITRIEME